jgi:hypothetical protein
MDVLLKNNRDLFINYAITDAIITLIHVNKMVDFYFGLNEVGVPITLSSLSKKYVLLEWEKAKYKGYQVSKRYFIGDTSRFLTPKGMIDNTSAGLGINYYIANYKGGRNESFMYGVDKNNM